MKTKILYILLSLFIFTGCIKHNYESIEDDYNRQKVDENVKTVFGTTFDPNQDWCTTSSGEITIKNTSSYDRIQLISYIEEEDGETSITVLNEAEINGQNSITLSYDIAADNIGMFVALYAANDYNVIKVTGDVVDAGYRAYTRGTVDQYTLPTKELKISVIEDSYASQRGWIPGEKLYALDEYTSMKIPASDYSDEYKAVFRAVIFSYFKNGRAYNNLPLIKDSEIYNDNAYPFTTGKDPIIISPVYKNDGGYKEIENSDLYYYYYKDENVGDNVTAYLESLPKYKAIPFNECIKNDNEICKHAAYALVYYGDGTPNENTVGSYIFPEGYKIGFMVRAKTTAENAKKQGELYGDGRLNNYINSYDKCNFKSSKLGVDGPRLGWITVNGKMLMCFESGTDSDFNDIIMEVEGGVIPIINIPEIESNFYTFCFEDTDLGDYDMNDVVIKARRKNETTVEYNVVACGAYDALKIMNINGQVINSNTEVHEMFNEGLIYINTVKGQNYTPITETITVDKKFSFLNESTQPYIYDITTEKTIKLSKKGEDPHGIMIPYDFKYPLERICIKDAYLQFNSWGKNSVTSTDWYKTPVLENVF